MNKNILLSFLRKIGLIKLLDRLRYYFLYIRTYKLRNQFFIENPDIKLPSSYYIYETFNLNYFSFYNKSIETAEWLISYFEKYKKLDNVNILDWGCGPGRVIRHIPKLVSDSCRIYGTDYNDKYIRWCIKNIPQIIFKTNHLKPPLIFENDYFDIIYGISVFTHLSKDMHFAWFNELARITKPEGIIFLTLQGDVYRDKLNEEEKYFYDKGNLVIRAKTKEGHRTFSAFQPSSFVKELIANNKILEHVPGIIKDGNPQQDIWIIKVIK
jgi:ubiquinone/menaquinone biosynthesis C-methylase UbiE